ncbi:MAG: type II toxin-antitoxin system VapB family antitoxin [Synergistaceae bacterium]|nr:type II toxin-antitoxin system VapB family antitoxin [Synergistaceae bacterium]
MPGDVAKVFENGRSQAVRLPKEYRFDTDEVFVSREGNKVILSPKPSVTWESFFASGPCSDFELDRSDNAAPQERELF